MVPSDPATTTTLPSTPLSTGPRPSTSGSPRRRRKTVQSAPLGSLLQAASQPTCPACGTSQLTVLSLVLTDGTAVRFSSCRGCEHRQWETEGTTLSITEVLERSRA
ncbi:hypothetical protein SAMN06264364_11597 [Quadrisphaera granulorum]|uniref:Uncharacterized protein n=1 Tax=Quadrisphaera granulorum TaxID=317664 RepID=A0A316A6D9_9ACTN|nr:hypothetical protein [Quadrisphaera granulorum]PWJ53079.1 hypothetical protein BXY45_11597 [Quadrisphaera granulorum]SZE97244.1 hypothetical protein SAMN06264364_11597 [Quadrisphaera granulorum]